MYLDPEGGVLTYCPDCAEREFGQGFVAPFFPDGS
jgi:hypothetical protein